MLKILMHFNDDIKSVVPPLLITVQNKDQSYPVYSTSIPLFHISPRIKCLFMLFFKINTIFSLNK